MNYETFEKAILNLGLDIHWYDKSLDVIAANGMVAKVWTDRENTVTLSKSIHELDPRLVSSIRTLCLGLAAVSIRKR